MKKRTVQNLYTFMTEVLLVEIYHNHKRVPLQELYERAMAKAKCRSA